MPCRISHSCKITLNSRVTNCQINVYCLVVPKIAKELPSVPVDTKSLSISNTIKLADPSFSSLGHIDMLLGGEFFLYILDEGRIELEMGSPILQNTKLGWIVSGPVMSRVNGGRIMNSSLVSALSKFI